MSLPRVSILYSNGNLLQDVAAIDGIAALCGTGSTPALQGVPNVVYNLTDAEEKGYTESAEPDLYRHLKEFYSEVAGNQKLYVMTLASTVTMPQMLDNTNNDGAKKLLAFARGEVRLLAVYHKPAAGYNGGVDFIDTQVQSAVTAAKTFCEARLKELTPIRVLIEGRVQNSEAVNTLQPATLSNGYAGVVLGGTQTDGSASVGLTLGRAVKYGAEIKLGKVANGPLSIDTAYIADKDITQRFDLETLHDAGFISFMTHPQKGGIFFGIDRMCSKDDYRLLAYGRIVDKAAVIAAAVYTEELESEVTVTPGGKIADVDIKHLESRITQQVNVAMGNQISDFQAVINPDQDIINTNTLNVQLRVLPLGYTTFINITLGLVAPGTNN